MIRRAGNRQPAVIACLHALPLQHGHFTSYTEEALGGNYWHCWLDAKPPRYKVWLDGLYMAQPFLARQASVMRDRAALERIARRFF